VPFALGIVTLIGLVSVAGHWGNDDPFITFRYAKNALAGHGLVYNVGERTLSTTAPLYALLLAGLGLVAPDLPALSNVLSALALMLGATLLFLWARDRQEPAVGLIAAAMTSLSPILLSTIGGETCLYVALVLAGLYAYDRSRLGLSAVVLALAAMMRPDAVLAAAAVGLYHLVRRRSILWQPVLIYAGMVGAWYVGVWFYYGSPIPVTLMAKQKQAELAASVGFQAGLLDLLVDYARLPFFWLQAGLALAGFVRVLIRARHWIPLILWTLLYVLAYSLLGVSSYPWYFAPLVPTFVVLVGEGIAGVVGAVAQIRPSRPVLAGLVGILLVAVLIPVLGGAIGTIWRPDPRLGFYEEIGNWLAEQTPEDATVGALEVGIIGYYSQRPMVGFAGLLQPEVAQQLSVSKSYLGSTAWAIETYEPDYVVLHQPASSPVTNSTWFQARYEPVQELTNQEALWLTLYRRNSAP
jgi:hypothetical protein